MEKYFPEFKVFIRPPKFGFQGMFTVRAGRVRMIVYEIVIEADENTYPSAPPAIYINPPIHRDFGNMLFDGQLCKQKNWNPARSTFANTVLDVIKYLKEHSA